jgi:glucose uptake protein GlcU
MVSFLDECTENCGWVAAIVAVIAWGSFGAPLKTSAKVEVNFFVMQTYKTVICFITCWFVLLLGVDLRWSNWGIASGLFWVPGAACGIYGIRNAGLAVAQGTWSAIQVLVSFVFGIIIFQEGVKSVYRTMCAFILLTVGLVGMSRYAEAGAAHAKITNNAMDDSDPGGGTYNPLPNHGTETTVHDDNGVHRKSKRIHKGSPIPIPVGPVIVPATKPLEMEALIDDEAVVMDGVNLQDNHDGRCRKDKMHFLIPNWGLGKPFRMTLTRHQMGILGAVINGAWGGCNMIPLHYAIRDDGLSGADYLISFATGSLLVNVIMWAALFAYHWHNRKGDFVEALEALPKFHLRELGVPGLMAGLLYSIGNFSSIIAVAYLGQATGFTFCQMQLFVSGLWGVFIFQEIQGFEIVTKWFTAAMIAVAGIIWLSYEHEGEAIGH